MTKIILTVLAGITVISPRLVEAEEEPLPIEIKVVDYIEDLIFREKEERLQNSPKVKLEKALEEALVKRIEEEEEAREIADAERRRQAELDRLIEESKKPISSGYGVQEVKFTNYYSGDSTGSSDRTAVGLTSNDFQVNEMGWYTYQGDVVLAGATNVCLDIQTGVCGQYNYLPGGFASYDFYDRTEFTLGGQRYTGVILDTCGACFWEEQRQRMDIFVTEGGRFGTQIGEVYH